MYFSLQGIKKTFVSIRPLNSWKNLALSLFPQSIERKYYPLGQGLDQLIGGYTLTDFPSGLV